MISSQENPKRRLDSVRQKAHRARRIAQSLGNEDQRRLISYAEELEEEARQLEKAVASAGKTAEGTDHA